MMTDQQLLDSTKKLIDAVLANGLVKNIIDAQGIVGYYQQLEQRLKADQKDKP